MQLNMGKKDRIARVVIGLTFVGMASMQIVGWWGYLFGIMAATGIVGICPFYYPFKINTCEKETKEAQKES